MAGERADARPGEVRLPRYREHAFGILAMFLVWVVARYMQWSARMDIFATTRFEFTIGLLLTVLCVGLLVSRPLPLGPARTLLIAIVLLFAAMLVQLPFAADPIMAKNTFVDRVVKFAFQAFFMLVLIQSPRHMRYFLYAFLFACFYVTQEAVRGLISGGLVWENQGVMRLHGAVPIYTHPNSLAGLAMGAVPFVVFLLPVWKKWYVRAGLLVLLGTSLTCVLYSGSRTAYVGFVSFALFWWLTSRKKLKWLMVALAVSAVTLPLVPEQYKGRFRSIGGEKAAEGNSKETRLEILSDAWQILLENPGGIGIASFPVVRMERFGRGQDTHNLYFEVATNLGVQGFVVFVLLMVGMFRAFHRARRDYGEQRARLTRWRRARDLPPRLRAAVRAHDEDLVFLAAICRAVTGFVYVRLVLGFFGMDLYEVYWWFAAGLGITLLNLTLRTRAITKRLEESCREVSATQV